MKKHDADFEDDEYKMEPDVPDGENFPTAVYTVYNVHGEPIGHKFYSYQPVYEPEDDEIIHREDSTEYESSEESEEEPNFTILKGGFFSDHEFDDKNEISENINKLKHQYFERYVEKRRKRFLNMKNSDDIKKELDFDLNATESTNSHVTTELTETKVRRRRDVNNEELNTDAPTKYIILQSANPNNDLDDEFLKVIPLNDEHKNNKSNKSELEMAIIPLEYKNTNSTEVANDKREKRTSRKTDRLNQTTATIPKT